MKRLAETFRREHTGQIVSVHIAGDVIESTGRHPYWVVRGEDLDSRPVTGELGVDNQPQPHPGRWVEARHLRVGDRLWTNSAGEVPIEDLLTCEAKTVVYNFHVAGCHSYAVGESGLLVHNDSPEDDSDDCAPVCKVDDGPGTPGPYAELEQKFDDVQITPNRAFDPQKQKPRILAANRRRNNGKLRSDATDDPVLGDLVAPARSIGGQPKPRDENGLLNEAQVDHIKPKSEGGSNSYCNARVISMQLNEDRRTSAR